jgi:hypothetical protein
MNKTKAASGKSMVRDGDGRFVVGNKEGRKFPKGYAGKPKGTKHKLTLVARQFAEDVLLLDPETGDRMTYYELCLHIRRKADLSPRIFIFLLEHLVGKPVEQVQHRVVPTFNIIGSTEPQDHAEDAEVVEGELFKLPEGK